MGAFASMGRETRRGGRQRLLACLEAGRGTLFTLLGAPVDRKRHAIYEGGHLPPLSEWIRDVLGWFDQ